MSSSVTGVTQNPTTPVASTSTDSAAGANDLFLKILVAELKAQDPTSPLDPNQMVGQMMSMNQLNELIQIRQLMQGSSSTTATGNNPAIPGGH